MISKIVDEHSVIRENRPDADMRIANVINVMQECAVPSNMGMNFFARSLIEELSDRRWPDLINVKATAFVLAAAAIHENGVF